MLALCFCVCVCVCVFFLNFIGLLLQKTDVLLHVVFSIYLILKCFVAMGSTCVLFQEMPLTGLIKTGMILFISVHYYMVDT